MVVGLGLWCGTLAAFSTLFSALLLFTSLTFVRLLLRITTLGHTSSLLRSLSLHCFHHRHILSFFIATTWSHYCHRFSVILITLFRRHAAAAPEDAAARDATTPQGCCATACGSPSRRRMEQLPKPNKAVGLDRHPMKFWKVVLRASGDQWPSEGAAFLFQLCNLAWSGACVPKAWQLQRVAFFYKKADPSLCSNYRPICVLNAASIGASSFSKSTLTF